MDPRSLLDHPPLNTPTKIICYLRGMNVRLTGKNVFFLQIEYYLKNQVTSSLKDIVENLWSSASSPQKRNFEFMAQMVNLTDERYKRKCFHKHRSQNNNFANDLINGIL